MINHSENIYTPTYLSVPKLEMLIEKISKLSIKKVDKTTLQTFGLSGSDLSLGSITLKFLGITTESDEIILDSINLLRSMDPQKHKDGLRQIIERSYSKLFETRSDINTASRDDVAETIRVAYEVSPRIAKGAAPAFIYLCQRAGLRAEDEELQRRKSVPRTRSAHSKIKSSERKKLRDTDTSHTPPEPNSKKRVLEGIGWRIVVESDFPLDKDVRTSLLNLENSLEELAGKNLNNETETETEK